MFKQILEELNRTKKLMNLFESENEVNAIILGDDIIDYVDDKDLKKIESLSDENLKVKGLISKLKNEEEKPDVDYVFLSIGKNDEFEDTEKIFTLTDLLKTKFPNAQFSIIRPILSTLEIKNFESDNKENEKNANAFYDIFKENGFDVVGGYRILDGEKSGIEKKIKSLKDEILNKIVKDVTNVSSDKDIELPYKNDDISGDKETDFDTIYEFLNRFEEMVKSDNVYKKNMSSSFKPDIEQIQIALKFIDVDNSDLEITGKYDTDTSKAISIFQERNNIEETGSADKDTLEELFYELKVKGFDEKDLSKFIKEIESKSGIKYFSSAVSDKKDKKNVAAAVAGGAALAGGALAVSLIDSGKISKSAGSKTEDERIYKAILDGVGADHTDENMLFFHAWRQGEGGTATYNPFNTTQPFNNASKYNSVGVRNYNNEDDGIKATVKTLKNGYYPCILDGLRRNIGAKNISKNCLSNLEKWGTGDLIFKVLNRGGSFTPPPIYRKNN